MSSVRGVNVGGNLFGVTDSTNIAPIETTNFATRAYAKDRCFIMIDGLLYRATAEIESGDPIVINGNCKRTTLDEIISVIETDSDLIAPTEDGATSSANYVVGDEIVRSGILYKVISAITQGDAFAIGSNIEIAGSLTSQIQTLTNGEITRAKNGAHNLLDLNINKVKASNTVGTWTGNSYTLYGITFACTVNADSQITQISINGTATDLASLKFGQLGSLHLNNDESYIFKSGCDTASTNTYYLNIPGVDSGKNIDFIYASSLSSTDMRLIVKNGTVISTAVFFYPMVVLASDPHTEYTPYAMTNAEISSLIRDFKENAEWATLDSTKTLGAIIKYRKINNMLEITGLDTAITGIAGGSWINAGTLPSGFRPINAATNVRIPVLIDSVYSLTGVLQITKNTGEISVYTKSGNSITTLCFHALIPLGQ